MGRIRTVTEKQEQDVCEMYTAAFSNDEIMEAVGIKSVGTLYSILREHKVELRGRQTHNATATTNGNGKAHANGNGSAPKKPLREWYLLDECAAIVGMTAVDIEWLIRRGVVYAETDATEKYTLVYLPSLVEANKHAGIDGKRAQELLREAWGQLDKIARQKAINLDDVKFITTHIREFFTANGWGL